MPPSTKATEGQLSGADLEKGLAAGAFEPPPARLTGMVKASEKQDHISFTPAGCEAWVDLPTAMIESAEHVGHQTCRDHSHPVFALSLKDPKDPQAKVLLALLKGFETAGLDPMAEPYNWGGAEPDLEDGYSARFANDKEIPPQRCKDCVCSKCYWKCVKQGKVRIHHPSGPRFRIGCIERVWTCEDCKEASVY